jgi:tetraacyldisaccharide-1-P 4'-kinase
MNRQIAQARAQQQQGQVRAIRIQRNRPVAMIATTGDRADSDGNYRLKAPDGGTIVAQYNSSSVPNPIPAFVLRGAAIGQPANFTQRPA